MTQDPPGPTPWEAPSGGGEPTTPGSTPGWGQPTPPGQPGWGQPAPQGQQPTPGPVPPPPGQPGWGQPPGQAPGWGQPPGQPPGWGQPPAWGAAAGTGPWVAHAKPGVIPLRPLALGEIFDGGFQAIRSNPRTMIGLSAVVLAIVTAVTAVPQAFLMQGAGAALANAAPTFEDQLNAINSSFQATGISSFVTLIAVQIITAMLVLAVSSAVLGQRIGPGQAWARVRGRVLAVLGLALVQAITIVVALLVPIVPGVIVGFAGSPAAGFGLGALGLFCGILLAIFLGIRLSFSAPALLLEEQGVFAAMGRSFRLVRGTFWRVLGITLLAQVVVGIGSLVIQTPFSAVSALIQVASGDHPYQDFWTNLGQLAVQGIGQVIAGAVFYPFSAAVTTLLYIDVRMRREGLDVELLRAAEAGPGTPG